MTDSGLILLESDGTGVVQCVLDGPVVPDCEARRYGGIGHVVCDLGGAAPEAGLGISMQDLAGDADDRFDERFPLGCGNRAGRAEDVGRPGFVSVAPGADRGVAADGPLGSACGFDFLQKRGLIVLQLDDEASLRLCGGLEGFFGNAWHRG